MALAYQPSPELSVVLSAAALGCRRHRANALNISWQQLDWDKTVKLANFHGLSCWLAEYIKEVEQVPESIKHRLMKKQRVQLLTYLHIEQQKSELTSALNGLGIRFALLKGGAVAKSLYKHRWYYRALSDVDILVEPSQLKATFELLHSLGFSDVNQYPLTESAIEQIAKYHQHLNVIEHTLQFPKQKLELDVHWKLRNEVLFPLSSEKLFSEIIRDEEVGFRLSTSVEFIHLCAHGMGDGWRKLKALVDIMYYAENITDWNLIDETAEQLGLSHVVNVSLALCDFFFATEYRAKSNLTKKERVLFDFVLNGFNRDNESPPVHSYLDKRNLYCFIKTSLSWWLALSSQLFSVTRVIKFILTPNNTDLSQGKLPRTDKFGFSFFIRIKRVIRKYLWVKG